MKLKTTLSLLILVTIIATAIPLMGIADANPNIDSAGISLSSTMSARFTCSASGYYDISVYSVKLEVKNASGGWAFVSWLTAPPSAASTSNYVKMMSYASSCTVGKTYRISATFNASGETVIRTSNERKYN